MITDEIQEQIRYHEDDLAVCLKILDNPESTKKEKCEARMRARANRKEIMRLACLFISLRGDELMYGGDYDK